MAQFTTPLENLFLYIRDIFGSPTACLDFEREKNNEKSKDVNYWDISSIFEIAKKAKQKNISELEFILSSELEGLDNTVLKVSKVPMPPIPVVPIEIRDWIEITKYNDSFSNIAHKEEIEQIEQFEDSTNRNSALNKYEKEIQNPLFPIELPAILDGWVTFRGQQMEVIHERVMKVRFEADLIRVSHYKKFESEIIKYYQRYEVPIKINNLYEGLHRLHYDIKGRNNIKLYLSFGLITGNIGGVNYRNFTFHIPLNLTLKSHQLKIEFDTFSNKILAEQNFIGLIDEHFKNESLNAIESKKKDIISAIENFNEQPQQFIFDKGFIRSTFYNKAIEILSIFPTKEDVFLNENELNFELDGFLKNIRLSFSPIIQTKLVEAKTSVMSI